MVARGIDATTVEAYARYRAACRFDDDACRPRPGGGGQGAAAPLRVAVERSGEVVADGWTVHACVDATTLRPMRIPSDLRETIAAIERA